MCLGLAVGAAVLRAPLAAKLADEGDREAKYIALRGRYGAVARTTVKRELKRRKLDTQGSHEQVPRRTPRGAQAPSASSAAGRPRPAPSRRAAGRGGGIDTTGGIDTIHGGTVVHHRSPPGLAS